MKGNSYFDALPAYPGGKRRLLPHILRHLPPATEAPRVADPFFGGGSVSLMLKARGHEVVACDIAERSYLAARALVENDGQRVTDDDRLRLLEPRDVRPFVAQHFAPRFISTRHAQAADLMLTNLDHFEDPLKRDLMKYAVLKYLLALMPFNQFSASGSYWEPLAEGDFDQIREPYHVHLKDAFLAPATLLRRIARVINRGVFGNGRQNGVARADVFDFLASMGEIDVLYLDPPYAGTLAYEKEFARLDQILALDLDAVLPISAFSQAGALRQVERLFELTTNIPVTILSYGNAEVSLEELTAIVRRHRSKVEAQELRYRHMANRAGAAKNETNREYLIVARA